MVVGDDFVGKAVLSKGNYDVRKIANLLEYSSAAVNSWLVSLLDAGYQLATQKGGWKRELEEIDYKALCKMQQLIHLQGLTIKDASIRVARQFKDRIEHFPEDNIDKLKAQAETATNKGNEDDRVEVTFGQMVEQLQLGQSAYQATDYVKSTKYVRRKEGIMVSKNGTEERMGSMYTKIIESKYIIEPSSIVTTFLPARDAAKVGKRIKPINMMTWMTWEQISKVRFTIEEIDGKWEISTD